MYALLWMHTNTNTHWALWGVIFDGKSQPILLMNLLMQNAIYIMQYVNCIMHNVCTHMDAYKKKCTLCLVGCNFLWEKSTNIINEFTQP